MSLGFGVEVEGLDWTPILELVRDNSMRNKLEKRCESAMAIEH